MASCRSRDMRPTSILPGGIIELVAQPLGCLGQRRLRRLGGSVLCSGLKAGDRDSVNAVLPKKTQLPLSIGVVFFIFPEVSGRAIFIKKVFPRVYLPPCAPAVKHLSARVFNFNFYFHLKVVPRVYLLPFAPALKSPSGEVFHFYFNFHFNFH